ncbi:hypothetical protein BDZ88DRAFT_418453 [Geranomyces variabilis]|nr:hypothetical protein BDZ88DRAFT_418453 [Geranomyces variabilis]KAJ3133320.1 hypothetical protein HDU90_006268 [Geranomyces variabilis]
MSFRRTRSLFLPAAAALLFILLVVLAEPCAAAPGPTTARPAATPTPAANQAPYIPTKREARKLFDDDLQREIVAAPIWLGICAVGISTSLLISYFQSRTPRIMWHMTAAPNHPDDRLRPATATVDARRSAKPAARPESVYDHRLLHPSESMRRPRTGAPWERRNGRDSMLVAALSPSGFFVSEDSHARPSVRDSGRGAAAWPGHGETGWRAQRYEGEEEENDDDDEDWGDVYADESAAAATAAEAIEMEQATRRQQQRLQYHQQTQQQQQQQEQQEQQQQQQQQQQPFSQSLRRESPPHRNQQWEHEDEPYGMPPASNIEPVLAAIDHYSMPRKPYGQYPQSSYQQPHQQQAHRSHSRRESPEAVSRQQTLQSQRSGTSQSPDLRQYPVLPSLQTTSEPRRNVSQQRQSPRSPAAATSPSTPFPPPQAVQIHHAQQIVQQHLPFAYRVETVTATPSPTVVQPPPSRSSSLSRRRRSSSLDRPLRQNSRQREPSSPPRPPPSTLPHNPHDSRADTLVRTFSAYAHQSRMAPPRAPPPAATAAAADTLVRTFSAYGHKSRLPPTRPPPVDTNPRKLTAPRRGTSVNPGTQPINHPVAMYTLDRIFDRYGLDAEEDDERALLPPRTA